MGAAAAPVATVSSIASLGLKADADITSGLATKQADTVKAQNYLFQGQQQLEQYGIESQKDLIEASENDTAVQFGKLQADMTDAASREQLTKTLGNISTARAAGGADFTSPTTAALEGHVTDIANLNRTAAVSSINAQTAQEKAAADYERQAANFALIQGSAAQGMGQYNAAAEMSAGDTAETMGFFTAGADILGGLGKAFASKSA